MSNGPAEATTSREANTDDMAAQQGMPPTDTPALTAPTPQSTNYWSIPDQLCVSNDGVVRVSGFGLYIGLRFKNHRLSTAQSQSITLRSSARPMTVNSSSVCPCRSR